MIKIVKLDRDSWAGKKFTITYWTKGYYDIVQSGSGFSIQYKTFDQTKEMSYSDSCFVKWLEHPVAFGAFEHGNMVGYVEGSLEGWNNRYRISNIFVSEHSMRHKGIGTLLMDAALSEARKAGARMTVLETQTCNERAISFYQKQGFQIIGFDLYAYSNNDPERHEIRLEMGKPLV